MRQLKALGVALCAPFALLGESVTWKGPSGGLFDATVKKLDWVKVTQNPEQSILANLDRTGLAPLKVSGDVVGKDL